MQAALYYFILVIAMGFSLSSCQKDEDTTPPQGQMITQEFTLETVTGYDMTKSFDPDEWVYQYSNQQFELKLQSTDGQYTYTKMVSVVEMLSGTITFQMWSGTYNVSYSPVHSPKVLNGIGCQH